MESAAERSQRLETIVAILIAIATVIGAVVAWRSSVARRSSSCTRDEIGRSSTAYRSPGLAPPLRERPCASSPRATTVPASADCSSRGLGSRTN